MTNSAKVQKVTKYFYCHVELRSKTTIATSRITNNYNFIIDTEPASVLLKHRLFVTYLWAFPFKFWYVIGCSPFFIYTFRFLRKASNYGNNKWHHNCIASKHWSLSTTVAFISLFILLSIIIMACVFIGIFLFLSFSIFQQRIATVCSVLSARNIFFVFDYANVQLTWSIVSIFVACAFS